MTDQKPTPLDLLTRQTQLLATLALDVRDLKTLVEAQKQQQVKVIDVNMPFLSLIGLLVKVSLAAIPAGLILGVLGALVFAALGSSCSALL